MVRNLYWKFLGCLYLYLGCLLRLSRYLGKHVLLWLAFQVTNIGNTARCAAQIRYRTRYSDRWIKRYEKKRQPFQLIIINDLSSFSSIAYLPFPSSLPTPLILPSHSLYPSLRWIPLPSSLYPPLTSHSPSLEARTAPSQASPSHEIPYYTFPSPSTWAPVPREPAAITSPTYCSYSYYFICFYFI